MWSTVAKLWHRCAVLRHNFHVFLSSGSMKTKSITWDVTDKMLPRLRHAVQHSDTTSNRHHELQCPVNTVHYELDEQIIYLFNIIGVDYYANKGNNNNPKAICTTSSSRDIHQSKEWLETMVTNAIIEKWSIFFFIHSLCRALLTC